MAGEKKFFIEKNLKHVQPLTFHLVCMPTTTLLNSPFKFEAYANSRYGMLATMSGCYVPPPLYFLANGSLLTKEVLYLHKGLLLFNYL